MLHSHHVEMVKSIKAKHQMQNGATKLSPGTVSSKVEYIHTYKRNSSLLPTPCKVSSYKDTQACK